MRGAPSARAAAAATMVAIGLCGLVMLRPEEGQRGLTFTALQPPAVSQLPARSAAIPIGASARTAPMGEASFSAPSASSAVAVAACAALLAGLAARRGSRKEGSKVAMSVARAKWYFNPRSKGYKPLYTRPVSRPYMKRLIEESTKKYKTNDDVEEMMKKSLYGNMKMSFSSPHFVDSIPFLGPGAEAATRGAAFDHQYDDPLYVRKFLEPAKFKKLEMVNWEMPENFTKAVTMQELVQSGMQFGHNAHLWSPKMLPYIYSNMDNTHIFDLVQTAAQLNRACYYLMEAASKGAQFLFVGTKEQVGPIIKEHATRCGAHYCDIRFVGGLITNFNQVGKGIAIMKKLQRQKSQGAWKGESPEQLERNTLALARQLRKYSGVQNMESIPDIMVVVDPVKERAAIAEAEKWGIPVIALCDSNSNPDNVDLVVPGNASGAKAVELYLHKITEAINLGLNLKGSTAPGDMAEVKPQWDPWLFSLDRLRWSRRRSRRQPWMQEKYGGYEQWKKAHPWGRIPDMQEFRKFSWSE